MARSRHYNRFIRALKTARIAKPIVPLSKEEILKYRSSLLRTIIQEAGCVQDFSSLILQGMNLEAILSQLQQLSKSEIHNNTPNVDAMSRRIAIPLIIEGIYRDIDTYSRDPPKKEREVIAVWDNLFGRLRSEPIWYDEALKQLGRPLLGYIIRSRTFLAAAVDLSPSTFSTLLSIISENSVSLTIFVRVRLHRIKDLDALTGKEIPDKFPSLKIRHDHHMYIVPPNGSSTIVQNLTKRKAANIFSQDNFRCVERPDSWPTTLPWPSHPGARHPDTECYMCSSKDLCPCLPPGAYDGTFLLELHDYGSLGVGVRTLQRIPGSTILGEYVGRFRHCNANIDTTYAMHFSNPSADDDDDDSGDPIALLDASKEGNWTRFINHTCEDANVRFISVYIGAEKRIVVQSVREISLYEQLTIDYGAGYWEGRVCLCGKRGCFSPPRKLKGSKKRKVRQGSTWMVKELDGSGDEDASADGLDVWWMSDDQHLESTDYGTSDSEFDGDNDGAPPAKRLKRTISAATGEGAKGVKGAKKMTRKEIDAIEAAEKAIRLRGAAQRVKTKREDKVKDKVWMKRWIGHENADRPRRRVRKIGGPFFAQF